MAAAANAFGRACLGALGLVALCLFALGLACVTPSRASAQAETADASLVRTDVPSTTKASLPLPAPPAIGAASANPVVVGRADVAAMVEREAGRAGMPPEIAEAIAHTESSFNPAAIGGDGEIGIMQILPSTARMLGFVGTTRDLAVPETNIRYGVMYLAQAWRLASGDLCTAAMKYRAGHGETRFSYLSVDYCQRVRARLMSRGFKVAGIVPTATFGRSVASSGGGGRCRGRCLGGAGRGPDLAALNSRLSEISFRVTVLKVPMR